ncbi:hypothetical protein AAJV73_12455 [Cyanobium sp. BSA11S]|uniref:hypothetical protein n=1 Tax=Cyanobium sp. BSA11S TaxID=3108224 RepID=UPI003D815845
MEHFLALQPLLFDLAMAITGQVTRSRQGSIEGQTSFTAGRVGVEKSSIHPSAAEQVVAYKHHRLV